MLELVLGLRRAKVAIQWFPGHMTKALREMEKEIKNVDLIFYCLDARAPLSCLNPKLNEVAKNKKIIYILNKSDLADEKKLQIFKKILTSKNSIVVSLNSTKSNSSKILFEKSKEFLKEKIENKKQKGQNYSIKAMVVGVPNCGKSTLINNLCKKSKTATGNRPGVTKGKQWVSVSDELVLLDTPGTLWPSFENKKTAQNLAYIGSIKDEVVDLTDLAFEFLNDIIKINSNLLKIRYNVDTTNKSVLEVFDQICLSRRCLLKGNELDYERCATLILDDFRKGRLGKIILDNPLNKI